MYELNWHGQAARGVMVKSVQCVRRRIVFPGREQRGVPAEGLMGGGRKMNEQLLQRGQSWEAQGFAVDALKLL